MKEKIIITYGTFDLFHIGHLNILQRAKELGSKLIVAVSTDDFNTVKGKKVIIPYEQRAEIVRNIKCVDEVIPEKDWKQKESDINKYSVDIFVMGDDWRGQFDELNAYCEVVYLARTDGVSSTGLKKSLKQIVSTPPQQLREAIDVIERLLKDLE